jgi:hypothetical protein
VNWIVQRQRARVLVRATSLNLLVLTVVMLCIGSAAVAADVRVVFTIDVESNDISLPDQVDAVCTDGSHCGLMEIARILRARGWRGAFFLNVYEERRWGAERMRRIAQALQDAGQDVELHTHPQWAYDPQRWAMWSYSLDEQTRILQDGKRLLESWTGRPVVAHRAGAYAANDDTLTALARSGIRIDSSYFWRHPENRQTVSTLPRNLPSRHGGVLELPVTVFQRQDRPGVFGASFPAITKVRKLDPNWLVDEHETRAALAATLSADIPVIVVFLHSFSFIKEARGGSFIADQHAQDLFKQMVEEVSRRAVPVVPIRDLATLDAEARTIADVVPTVAIDVGISRYLWHVAKQVPRMAIALSVTAGATFILIVALRAHGKRPVEPGAAARPCEHRRSV